MAFLLHSFRHFVERHAEAVGDPLHVVDAHVPCAAFHIGEVSRTHPDPRGEAALGQSALVAQILDPPRRSLILNPYCTLIVDMRPCSGMDGCRVHHFE